MTTLYINEEHCTSLEQLRSYFEDSLNYDSSIFYDLLDYARSGDLSLWLREKGESGLADKVDGIAGNLGDSEYYSCLSVLMTGNEATSDGLEKPDFSKCFHVEDFRLEKKADGMDVHVHLKVLSSVNETYKFSVRTSWGQKGDTINPFHEEKGGILMMSFFFRKRPNIDFKDVVLLADGKDLKDVQSVGLGADTLEFEVGSCRFKMIRVEHGTFMMGATEEMKDFCEDDLPVHKVTLTNTYYIGETQVTLELWKAVMGYSNNESDRNGVPVYAVSWVECQAFIALLNQKTGRTFRLPTEAEWEFAARGGNKSRHTRYSGSNNVDDVAWCSGNSTGGPQRVMTKMANELGIYDMCGNVWELCQDRWANYSCKVQTNPTGPESGDYCVKRGGCYDDYEDACCLSCRKHTEIDLCRMGDGFRLALSE